MIQGDGGAWLNGPSDWADEIELRLDSGDRVRLRFPDPVLVTGLRCVGPVPDALEVGGRSVKSGRGEDLCGVVREETISIEDRVYVCGVFSNASEARDDPMRRDGVATDAPAWLVRSQADGRQVRLHRDGFVAFGAFGSVSLRRHVAVLSITIPAFALYLGFALLVFGRLW